MLITEWIERFNPCFAYFFYKRAEIIKPNDSVSRILYNHQISTADKKWLVDNTLNKVGQVIGYQINSLTWVLKIIDKDRRTSRNLRISTPDLARFMEEIIDYIGEQEDED